MCYNKQKRRSCEKNDSQGDVRKEDMLNGKIVNEEISIKFYGFCGNDFRFRLFNYGAAQVIIDGNPMSYYDDTTNTYTIQDGDVITVKIDGVTIEGNGANTDVSIIVDDTSVESLTLDGVNYTAPSNVLGLRINNSAVRFYA